MHWRNRNDQIHPQPVQPDRAALPDISPAAWATTCFPLWLMMAEMDLTQGLRLTHTAGDASGHRELSYTLASKTPGGPLTHVPGRQSVHGGPHALEWVLLAGGPETGTAAAAWLFYLLPSRGDVERAE